MYSVHKNETNIIEDIGGGSYANKNLIEINYIIFKTQKSQFRGGNTCAKRWWDYWVFHTNWVGLEWVVPENRSNKSTYCKYLDFYFK